MDVKIDLKEVNFGALTSGVPFRTDIVCLCLPILRHTYRGRAGVDMRKDKGRLFPAYDKVYVSFEVPLSSDITTFLTYRMTN